MFFGQINAPGTLPIYVLIHLLNSKFLGWPYRTLPACQFFLHYTTLPLFWICWTSKGEREARNIPNPLSHGKEYCYMMYICVTACYILEFSSVYPALPCPTLRPSSLSVNESLVWQTKCRDPIALTQYVIKCLRPHYC